MKASRLAACGLAAFAMTAGAAPATAGEAPAASSPMLVWNLPSRDKPCNLPHWPDDVRQRVHVEDPQFRVDVGTEDDVQQVLVVRSSGQPVIDQAVAKALRHHCSFRSVRVHDKPAASATLLQYHWADGSLTGPAVQTSSSSSSAPSAYETAPSQPAQPPACGFPTDDEYPAQAMRRNIQGTTRTRLHVDTATGVITSVELVASSGSALLDDPVLIHLKACRTMGDFEASKVKQFDMPAPAQPTTVWKPTYELEYRWKLDTQWPAEAHCAPPDPALAKGRNDFTGPTRVRVLLDPGSHQIANVRMRKSSGSDFLDDRVEANLWACQTGPEILAHWPAPYAPLPDAAASAASAPGADARTFDVEVPWSAK